MVPFDKSHGMTSFTYGNYVSIFCTVSEI